MEQIITLVLMLGSLGGIAFILRRKIPLLIESPENESNAKGDFGQTIKKVVRSQSLQRAKFLEGTVANTRRLARLAARQASKTGAHGADLLEKLQKGSEERKEEFRESYWDKLQKKSRRKK